MVLSTQKYIGFGSYIHPHSYTKLRAIGQVVGIYRIAINTI